MVQRVKELAERAGLVWDDQHHWRVSAASLERFTHVILSECIAWCNAHARDDGTAARIVDSIREDFGYRVDTAGRGPRFFGGERVFVGPLGMEATVVRQVLHYDGPDSFWGNLELIYDDGTRGISNSWQCQLLDPKPAEAGSG